MRSADLFSSPPFGRRTKSSCGDGAGGVALPSAGLGGAKGVPPRCVPIPSSPPKSRAQRDAWEFPGAERELSQDVLNCTKWDLSSKKCFPLFSELLI